MAIFAILVLAVAFPSFRSTPSTLMQAGKPVADENSEVGELVGLLWSSDHAQRRSAKGKLLRIGSSAIPPLVSLLQDIYAYPGKARFPTGMEEEARQILDHYQDYPPEDLENIEITGRLKDDAAGLLGHLHAVNAVPILIGVLHRQVEISFPRGLNRVMRSLVKIGPPAVPALIEQIENAVTNAPLLLLRDETASNEFGHRSSVDAQGNQSTEGREVAIIRIRAALILGEIGDERALPILKGLVDGTCKSAPMEIESQWAAHAINRITAKIAQPAISKPTSSSPR